MSARERNLEIKQLLVEQEHVKVADLVKKYNVSEETIRRDLQKLEQDGVAKKVYGGATLIKSNEPDDKILPIHERKNRFYDEKKKIGEAAAKLVSSEQTLIIDAGSTTWHLANQLSDIDRLIVITNAINIAEECSKNESNQSEAPQST